MITLITGTPGQGKTVKAVWDEIRPAVEQGRPVYYNGIPKLQLPAIRLLDDEVRNWSTLQLPSHFECFKDSDGFDHEVKIFDRQERAKFLEYQEENHKQLSFIEEGSLIVIDEAQRIFRPMGTGVAIPDYLAYLEYHRHHGIDFVLLTQHPKLIHVNCRALVGRHIHLRNGIIGRVSHEWSEWTENPHTKSTRSNAITRRNALPKAAFDLFESASIHVKPKKRFPMAIAVVLFAVVAVPAGAAMLWHQLHKPVIEAKHVDTLDVSNQKLPGNGSGGVASSSRVTTSAVPALPPFQYKVSDQVNWSKVAGCADLRGQVQCYDDSGAKIILPQETARLALENGWPGRTWPAPPIKDEGAQKSGPEKPNEIDKKPEGGGTTTEGLLSALKSTYPVKIEAHPSY